MRNMGCEDFSKAMGVKEEMNAEAEITDIQRFSVHDGTGIRTLVFFKGCPLRCIWCHNPETQRKQPQLFCIESKCIHCGACILACPKQAVSVKGEELTGPAALNVENASKYVFLEHEKLLAGNTQ